MFKKCYVLFLIFFFVLPFPIVAGEAEDKALEVFSQTAIKTATQEMLKTSLNDFVVSQMGETAFDQYLVDQFGESASTGVVNQAFATYNLYKSAKAYDKSETQSEKYYAAVGVIGSAISFVNPAIGSLVMLGNAASQIVSAVLTKEKLKDLLETQKQIIAIYQNIQNNSGKMIKADIVYLNHLFGSYFYYFNEAIKLDGLINVKCSIISQTDAKQATRCFDYIVQRHNYLKFTISYLTLSLNFSNQYMDIDKFLTAINKGINLEQLKENLQYLRASLSEEDKKIGQLYSDLGRALFQLALETQKRDARILIEKNSCQTNANNSLMIANKLEYQLMDPTIDLTIVNRLLSFRNQKLISLKLNIEQCLLIGSLTKGEKNQLNNKHSLAVKMLSKDFSDYLSIYFPART